ncbi:MAG TPA: DNA gyrase modulator, partial [Candidatus Hydrogenedentes bacterium]|nr:DNA gyrase modulator [Candidatus Hydrogenedentota bacterium]
MIDLEKHAEAILATALRNGGQLAEIFLEETVRTSIILENNKVERVVTGTDAGAGIRHLSGDQTLYGHTNELTEPSLIALAAEIAGGACGDAPACNFAFAPERLGAVPKVPPSDVPSSRKLELIRNANAAVRAHDPRIVQVMAGVAAEYDVVLVARADGTRAADVRPLVRLSITVIAEHNGRREVGSGGGGGRFGLGYFQDEQLRLYVDQAVNAALTNLDSRPAPAGEMTVVLGPGWPGVLLHEAVGHGLEGDFNRKGLSAFSGR